MKKANLLFIIAALAITSCTTTAPVAKSVAYKGMYEEKPLVALIMPPINRSTNIDAKEYFHSTLYTPASRCRILCNPTISFDGNHEKRKCL
jgi:hypothetical protein